MTRRLSQRWIKSKEKVQGRRKGPEPGKTVGLEALNEDQ